MTTAGASEREIEHIIEDRLVKRGSTIRNKAALGALAKILPVVGEGLYHALTAGSAALKDEKRQLQLDLLCDLVQKIDASITEMLSKAKARGADFFEISGNVNVKGERAENVTGLDMTSGRSGTIKPGTVVNVEGRDVKNVTGVKI